MEKWIEKALEIGFSAAIPLKMETLQPLPAIRDACSADKCRAYGKNWTCPPHCGTLAECEARIHSFSQGILLQTVGTLEKAIDTKGYRRTEQLHLSMFHQLARRIRDSQPNVLCLGSGGCRLCESCAYPEPCRFPDQACSSMEGYGLFVTQICRDHQIPYHHGEKTITYTACILFP